MIARLLTACIVAIVLVVLLAALAAAHAGWPGPAVAAVACAPLLLLTAAYAVEGLWMLRRAGDDPQTPRPALSRVVLALLEEAARALPIFLWHQPRARRPMPDVAPADPDRRLGRVGVLLVHGYTCNAGFWHDWIPWLQGTGRPHLAVTMEPPFGTVDALTDDLDAALRRLQRATGRPVVVVAHSMGGVVVRAWWRRHADWADTWVARVVTIGTPHRGTALAAWALTENARQLQADSGWLRALADAEPTERRRRFVCVYADCDNVVFPPHRARLPDADAHLVRGAAHIAMAFRPEVRRLVAAVCDAAEAAPSPGA